jgi:hypothetical protein
MFPDPGLRARKARTTTWAVSLRPFRSSIMLIKFKLMTLSSPILGFISATFYQQPQKFITKLLVSSQGIGN